MEVSVSDPLLQDFYTLYGDYAFGHFLMCFDSVKGFTTECEEAHCHMDPGAFGSLAKPIWTPGVGNKHVDYT